MKLTKSNTNNNSVNTNNNDNDNTNSNSNNNNDNNNSISPPPNPFEKMLLSSAREVLGVSIVYVCIYILLLYLYECILYIVYFAVWYSGVCMYACMY